MITQARLEVPVRVIEPAATTADKPFLDVTYTIR